MALRPALALALSLFLVPACGMTDPPGGDGDGARTALSGRIASVGAAHTLRGVAPAEPRTITHVMAIDPEAAAPRRTLAVVGADGAWTLEIDAGRPYALVFLDDQAIGPAMVVAVVRAGSLDTLSPQLAAHLDLGDMAVDPDAQTAAIGISYDALLAGLGISADAAELLGAVDDLSLRYANPDIDGDGVIDLLQERSYAIDFHVRANLFLPGSDRPIIVDDITDQFVAESGEGAAIPAYNLTSIYVEYPAAMDGADYVAFGPPGLQLQNGAAFSATLADGSAAAANTSFSPLAFGDLRGWGPDYNFESDPALELPGSSGMPATLAYTLGSIGRTLTFTNVVTRPRAALAESGTLAIFVRLVTGTDGTYGAIDYKWMKRDGAAWVPATAEEIVLTISGDGGHISFRPAGQPDFGAQIPTDPAGTLAWPGPAMLPDELCGVAVSYDDTLGLRHFIGGAAPNPAATCN
jgi:hypothetical protein